MKTSDKNHQRNIRRKKLIFSHGLSRKNKDNLWLKNKILFVINSSDLNRLHQWMRNQNYEEFCMNNSQQNILQEMKKIVDLWYIWIIQFFIMNTLYVVTDLLFYNDNDIGNFKTKVCTKFLSVTWTRLFYCYIFHSDFKFMVWF